MKMTCPFCKAPLTMPDDYNGEDVDCPSCHKTFTAVPDDPTATDLSNKQVKIPKSVMNGSWTPPPAPKTHTASSSCLPCTNRDSFWVVLSTFAVVLVLGIVLEGVLAALESKLIPGILVSSVFGLVWSLWMLVCVRTIAINSSRK